MKKNENILIIKHGALGDLIQADGLLNQSGMNIKMQN